MNRFRTELKWSAIFAITILLWMLGEKLTGLHSVHIEKHPIYTNLVLIPVILLFNLALRDKSRQYYSGQMTFKQGFISGIIITLVTTFLSPWLQTVISKFISPEFFPNAIAYATENKLMSMEEAKGYFNLSNYIKQATMGNAMIGLVISALAPLPYLKNRNKEK